jgi:hypothetical protein
MALPDSAKYTIGTAIILADTTDHSPAANYNLGTRTDQIDCTDLAAGAARQSAKFDFHGEHGRGIRPCVCCRMGNDSGNRGG